LEVYQLDDSGRYQLCNPDATIVTGLPKWVCFGAMARPEKIGRGYWLRWWDENGELLLWELERGTNGYAQLGQPE